MNAQRKHTTVTHWQLVLTVWAVTLVGARMVILVTAPQETVTVSTTEYSSATFCSKSF